MVDLENADMALIGVPTKTRGLWRDLDYKELGGHVGPPLR